MSAAGLSRACLSLMHDIMADPTEEMVAIFMTQHFLASPNPPNVSFCLLGDRRLMMIGAFSTQESVSHHVRRNMSFSNQWYSSYEERVDAECSLQKIFSERTL